MKGRYVTIVIRDEDNYHLAQEEVCVRSKRELVRKCEALCQLVQIEQNSEVHWELLYE